MQPNPQTARFRPYDAPLSAALRPDRQPPPVAELLTIHAGDRARWEVVDQPESRFQLVDWLR